MYRFWWRSHAAGRRWRPCPGGGTVRILLSPAINRSGQIAFQAFTSTGADGVFLFSNRVVTKIITSSDVFPDGVHFGFPEPPAISDSGHVVFGGISNSIADSGLFSFANGQLTIVVPRLAALPNGTALDLPLSTSVNNAGQIAFSAITEPGNRPGAVSIHERADNHRGSYRPASPDGGVFRLKSEGGASSTTLDRFCSRAAGRCTAQPSTCFPRISYSERSARAIRFRGSQHLSSPRPPALPRRSCVDSDRTFPGGNGGYTCNPHAW